MSEAFNGDTFIPLRVLELRDKYGLKTAIETGTNKGATSRWLAANFDFCYTVETNPEFVKLALNGGCLHNLAFMNCDSAIALQAIVPRVIDRAFVYLDAHWYDYWPLLDELKVLELSTYLPVIAIHDFKVPGSKLGYDKYNGVALDLAYVKDGLDRIYGEGNYTVEYNNDTKANGACRGIAYVVPHL